MLPLLGLRVETVTTMHFMHIPRDCDARCGEVQLMRMTSWDEAVGGCRSIAQAGRLTPHVSRFPEIGCEPFAESSDIKGCGTNDIKRRHQPLAAPN